jgi:hypothetical protein
MMDKEAFIMDLDFLLIYIGNDCILADKFWKHLMLNSLKQQCNCRSKTVVHRATTT